MYYAPLRKKTNKTNSKNKITLKIKAFLSRLDSKSSFVDIQTLAIFWYKPITSCNPEDSL